MQAAGPGLSKRLNSLVVVVGYHSLALGAGVITGIFTFKGIGT